jgi:hypothetical protein
MATGPLSLLGDALARGTGQMAAIAISERERERRRAEEQEDYNRRRQDALQDYRMQRDDRRADITEAQKQEEALYKRRRFDRLVDSLVERGYLSPEDIDKPDAVNAAMAKIETPEQRRAIEELATYKAALPRIIEAVGEVPNAAAVLGANPMDAASVQAARNVMNAAYSRLGQIAESDRERAQNNAKFAAAAYVAQLSKQTEIELAMEGDEQEIDRIQNGAYDAEMLMAERQKAAATRFPGKSEIDLRPDELAEVERVAMEGLADARFLRMAPIQSRYQNRVRQLQTAQRGVGYIAELSRAGAFAFAPEAAQKVTTATAAPATPGRTPPAIAGESDTDEFLSGLSGGMPRPASPAAVVGDLPSPPPASVVPQIQPLENIRDPRREEAPPPFFGPPGVRDNAANRQRVIDAGRAAFAAPMDSARAALGVIQPSNWETVETDDGREISVFGQTPEYVARLRERAAYFPQGTSFSRRLLDRANQIERSLAQRRTREAQAALGVGP